MTTNELLDLTPPPDASQATPTRRRPNEGALGSIDWSPLHLGFAATWGLVLSIWPHSALQRYAAIAYVGTAALALSGLRRRAASPWIRIAFLAAAGCATLGLALSISGVTAFAIWALGVLAVTAAAGIDDHALASWATVPLIGPSIERVTARSLQGAPIWSSPSHGAFAALGLAELAWWRTRSIALFCAAVGLALGLAWMSRRSPPLTVVDRALTRAMRGLSSAVALLLTGIIAVPVLYLPAMIAAGVRRLSGTSTGPEWTPVHVDPTAQRADRSRMFVTPPRGAGFRANAVAAVVVAAAAAITIALLANIDRKAVPPADVYAAAPPRTAPTTSPASTAPTAAQETTTTAPEDKARFSWTPFTDRELVPYSDRPAYLNDPLGDQIQSDQGNIALSANAVGGNRVDDFATKTFTVTDGERATLQPTCACPETVLWFFGGSAAFGIGQRNEHTIASELVRLAEQDKIALRVRNFGAPGWTIWQEFQAFSSRVDAAGQQKPDLAVFYDGFNDAVGSLFEAGVHGIRPDVPTLLTNGDVWSFVEAKTKIGGAQLDAIKQSARDKYRSVQLAIDQIAAASAVDTTYFFQPDAFTAPNQERAIKDLYGPDFSIFQQLQMTEMLDSLDPALTTGPNASSISLRHLFDDEPKTVFLDYVHTNEYAAKAVAAAMYPSLRAAILQRAEK